MKRKRMALFALALCVVGSALLTSCGTKPVSMLQIYEQVRNDAANGRLEKAKADWKDAVINANASEKLPDEVIQALKNYDIFPDTLPCFTLPEELSPQDILWFCDSFCWMFIDSHFRGYPNAAVEIYPAEWFEPKRGWSFAIMEKQTAERLVSDYFGFQNYSLSEQDLLWWWNYGDRKEPDFDNLRSGDTFCYVAHDPHPPALIYKSERSLGDGFFYVVFEQGWYYDEDPVVLEDLHVVIRVTDNFFGYQLISILQNDECSLL